MARSVTELLRRPFADLTLDDVAEIISNIGEERETLFFERKLAVTGKTLAKACSAFANTYGGLLVVGVADDDDTLVGTDPLQAEAQLWVKDTLRTLVLPMPPFRARWLPTADELGLLLVLVEESTTTPHLLTWSGAIYVRNPGSSDPVPIDDQRRLLDLTRRGQQASDDASLHARRALDLRLDTVDPTDVLALAATGVTAEFERRLFSTGTPTYLETLAWGAATEDGADARIEVWNQDRVGVRRRRRTAMSHIRGELVDGILATRLGVGVIYEGVAGGDSELRGGSALTPDGLRARLDFKLAALREALAELGAHGDLRLSYRLNLEGQYLQRGERVSQLPGVTVIECWTSFDDQEVSDRVVAEVFRASGVGPASADLEK